MDEFFGQHVGNPIHHLWILRYFISKRINWHNARNSISFITYLIHRVLSIVRAKNVLVLGNIRPNLILPNVGRWRASVWNANINKKFHLFSDQKKNHLFAIRYTYPFWHMVASNNGIRLQISTVTNYNGIQAIIKIQLKLIQKKKVEKKNDRRTKLTVVFPLCRRVKMAFVLKFLYLLALEHQA